MSSLQFLLYHGVRPDSDRESPDIRKKHVSERQFRQNIRWVKRWMNPVSMKQASGWLKGEDTLPKRAVCVTFDDGYADNATTAAKILRDEGVPAIFYLTTGFIDGTHALWVDRFENAFRKINPDPKADEKLRAEFKKLPEDVRETKLRELEERTGASQLFPLQKPMTWEQASDLLEQGFEIGAHTITHPILAACAAERMEHEILGSKKRIEEKLGNNCRHFAFPNGQPSDWNDAVVNTIKHAGYETCLTTIDGKVHKHDDPFLLKRNPVDYWSDPVRFALTALDLRAKLRAIKR
ncbi:polysaccharide deacetylase family protein [Candidatus Uhrbacteria bacterium]|nr:polysaccharide deacetylase family protein [Candidatus Uhrbacteria bacterium]